MKENGMKGKFVTFGELLLRFSKPAHQRLSQGRDILGNFGGSEANVAVSLATLGENVEYITRLPDNQMGHAGCMALRGYQVDVDHVLFGGDRIGTYYFEEAAGMRSPKVIYDRDNSSFFSLKPGMIDWRTILADADVFHASGIAGSISKESADATFEALDIANEMGLTISFDINYRKNLWKYGAEPREVLGRMLEYADVVFADVIEYEWITQHPEIPFTAVTSDFKMDFDAYRQWFDEIHARWPRCKQWLMGMRNMISSKHNTLTALLWNEGDMLTTRIYDIPDIVDPVGVGDAFLAGLNHARFAEPNNPQFGLDYALAAAALKNTIPGDFNLATDEEIRELMNS
jgi:2-dehydro-3-deoxygluconokinase